MGLFPLASLVLRIMHINTFMSCLFSIVLLCMTGWVNAQQTATTVWLDTARDELADMEKRIDTADKSLQSLRVLYKSRNQLVSIRSDARDCIDQSTATAATLRGRRIALGETIKDDDAEVIRLRNGLEGEIGRNEQQRIACEQIAQVSSNLLERIQVSEKAEIIDRLFARGVSALNAVSNAIQEPRAWSRLVAGFIDEGSGWERLTASQRWIAMSVIVLLSVAGITWRRYLLSKHKITGSMRYLVMSTPWLLAATSAGLLFMAYVPTWPPALITRLTLGILGWLVINIILQVWLDGRRAAGLAAHDAKSLLAWLRILALLVITGALITSAEAVIRLPDTHYFLLRAVMTWLLLVGIIWSAFLFGRMPGLAGTRGLRILMVLAVFVIAIAETLGYRNLSVHLLLGFGGTATGYGIANLLSRSATFLYDGMDEGRYAWQKSMRRWLELKSRETVPGLVWLRIATSLLIWSAFVIWTLWVWGQSERWIGQLTYYVTEGFNAGSLRIEPFKILGAIAVLAVGISLTRWIKQKIVADLVRRSRMDHGGREAIVTLSGYLGVIVSVLIALGVAGISYTHLAIIAGALSVGIGFGLQNVVNNFVSGLILLFERPIRTGDWIVVGDTTGYVRKISIRSTQIETFDRADVIVPNSELIAQKVSNWMLRDPWGRITIPVGVAYGSDVQKVIETLKQVANEHEGIIRDQHGVAPPKALFMRFGDSALEFELRCFIRQIDRIFDITHDLNVAIDRAFREAGITIPFPQRDVHVKSYPPGNDKKI
jgi:small-conductance mechanosensitive channel